MPDSCYEPARPSHRVISMPGAKHAPGTVADARCRGCSAWCHCEGEPNADYFGDNVRWVRRREEMVKPDYQQRLGAAVKFVMENDGIHRRPFQAFVEHTITRFEGVMRYRDDWRPVRLSSIPSFTYAFGDDLHASWVRDMTGWADAPMDEDAVASFAARIILVAMALIIAKPEITGRFDL